VLPDKKRYEDMVLAHFHAVAQLRNDVNKFVKRLEEEMVRVKGEVTKLNMSIESDAK
jgi:hypothetical protein